MSERDVEGGGVYHTQRVVVETEAPDTFEGYLMQVQEALGYELKDAVIGFMLDAWLAGKIAGRRDAQR